MKNYFLKKTSGPKRDGTQALAYVGQTLDFS